MFKTLKTTRTSNTPTTRGFNNMKSLQQWRLCYNNKCCRPNPEPEPEPQYGGDYQQTNTEAFNKGRYHMYEDDDSRRPSEDDDGCKCYTVKVFIGVFIAIASIIFLAILVLSLWFAYHYKQPWLANDVSKWSY